MNKETKFKVGDKAHKTKGYKFPCTIVGVFETIKGDIRVVGEMDEYGLLHIFNEDQLEHVEQKGMNKEKYNQIIDEVYEGYLNYPLATIHDHRTNILYQNIDKGWCMLNGRSMASPHPTRHLSQEEFINKCKTDPEFSEKWGLKIEERELTYEERIKLYEEKTNLSTTYTLSVKETLDKHNIPTKLITLTYNKETIEIYE